MTPVGTLSVVRCPLYDRYRKGRFFRSHLSKNVFGRCDNAVFNILVALGANDPRSLWGGSFHVSVLNKNLKKANPFGL